MQSYRKRISVQMQHKSTKPKESPLKIHNNRAAYTYVRGFLLQAIRIHGTVAKLYEPLSDEWKICMDELFRYKTDFEILEHGTYDERKEVIEKYGRRSH